MLFFYDSSRQALVLHPAATGFSQPVAVPIQDVLKPKWRDHPAPSPAFLTIAVTHVKHCEAETMDRTTPRCRKGLKPEEACSCPCSACMHLRSPRGLPITSQQVFLEGEHAMIPTWGPAELDPTIVGGGRIPFWSNKPDDFLMLPRPDGGGRIQVVPAGAVPRHR